MRSTHDVPQFVYPVGQGGRAACRERHVPDVRALFDAHAAELRRCAQRIVRSREAAEDVVQEVFLRLWLGRDRLELGSRTRSYLFIATRGQALNQLRRSRLVAQRERAAGGDVRLDVDVDVDVDIDVGGGEAMLLPDPERVALAVDRVLAQLPPRQREVAELRLRQQRTTTEIAAALGISPRTVEMHVGRARRALRVRVAALLAQVPEGVGPDAGAGGDR